MEFELLDGMTMGHWHVDLGAVDISTIVIF
jgi:hypothetical protein